MRSIHRSLITTITLPLVAVLLSAGSVAHADPVNAYFDKIKDQPVLLRDFLYRLPKGGELHTHLDGAAYAENYIAWAADDGKCIDLSTYTIMPPPCDTRADRPAVADIQFNADVTNKIIDAFSVRNYERQALSGHDQAFATFARFSNAVPGREGFILAEVTDRAARQNNHYLELIYITGMIEAMSLGASAEEFKNPDELERWLNNPALKQIFNKAVATTDAMEQQWQEVAHCAGKYPAPGCEVTVRHISAVIRTLPREMVVAQTVLAFMLVEHDSRYVGLNFVAPEDHPVALRDYDWQMQLIARLAPHFPHASQHITLHAGELAPALVPPEALLGNIRKAVTIAGARRIGHGTSIVHEEGAKDLLQQMARDKILVEINLTSNAIILGVAGKDHPFDLYRQYGVPMALSTDDEGVVRIDLTHEYQRAVQTYDLSYSDIKALSRNALAYSFLAGQNLFTGVREVQRNKACKQDRIGSDPSQSCETFLADNEKARLQWQLEQRFKIFEGGF
jgi:adenosine deaminase